MKLSILLVPLVLLAGCCTPVPVKRNFPPVPPELMAPCPDLVLIAPNTKKLSEVVHVVARNYGEYQVCQLKVEEWASWYDRQKKIFDEVE